MRMFGAGLIALIALSVVGVSDSHAKSQVPPAKHKRAITVDLRFGGGAIFPWDAMNET